VADTDGRKRITGRAEGRRKGDSEKREGREVLGQKKEEERKIHRRG
jgi:hypothetical protein